MQPVFPDFLLHSRWHARSLESTGESYSCSPCLRLEPSLGICLKVSQKASGEKDFQMEGAAYASPEKYEAAHRGEVFLLCVWKQG